MVLESVNPIGGHNGIISQNICAQKIPIYSQASLDRNFSGRLETLVHPPLDVLPLPVQGVVQRPQRTRSRDDLHLHSRRLPRVMAGNPAESGYEWFEPVSGDLR